jgi:ribosomal protein S3
MGQKTNSNILRLSLIKNEWKSKYIEKFSEESSFYTYNDLEIRKYLNRFFQLYGLIIHNCKVHYSNNTLNIFVSYFTTFRAIRRIKKTKMRGLRRKKNLMDSLNFSHSNFTEILLESLNQFTKKKVDIFFTFQNLNKGLSLKLNNTQALSFEKIRLELKQFRKTFFFEETLKILLIAVRKKNSSKLLSEFIAFQFTNMKKHNFFLIFLKRTVSLMLNSKVSSVNGIKIVIKGRFNGAPRARSVIIQIGNIPLQFFEANIDYSQTISYTPNGTFGIKVWICQN